MKKIIIIISILLSNHVFAQISPGDLTRAHSNLEGMSNCTKCHELGEAVKSSKCLSCHKDINELLNNNRGYHAHNNVKAKECFECHSEHHGVNFQIVRFDQDNFNHDLAGYSLTGKHKTLRCNQCHKTDFISDPEIKKRNKTFLGLTTKCANCHQDYHQQTLSSECENCHNILSFKPAPLFDHNKAAFRLAGGHVNVKCESCHKIIQRNGIEFQAFKGLSFKACISCHNDTHKGKFGNDCELCHSVDTFHRIKNVSLFDHTKTNFVLNGKHRKIECSKCHKNGYTKRIEHQKCMDCHLDFHKGELTKINPQRDCSECHSEERFSPSHFTIDNHQMSSFPLTGSHLAIPCSGCHKRETEWKFSYPDFRCINCHPDIHENIIDAKFLGSNECEQCHETSMWRKVTFDHTKTKFTLLGRHINIECSKCHTYIDDSGSKKYIFSDLLLNCESCHNDPHYKQFRVDEFTRCERCHGFDNWKPVNFKHELTSFPLDGAHIKVSCKSCHKSIGIPTGIFVKYKFESIECAYCHGKNKT